MKQFKAIIIGLILTILPFNSAFAIAGFGVQLGQNMFSVDASNPATGSEYITLTNGSFDGAFDAGAYFYLDVIPFIDLEIDLNVRGNSYDIDFQNAAGEMPTIQFGWVSTNTYYTARKKIVGLSIPFLAAAKLHAGGGINTHLTTPITDVDMVTELLGGDLLNASPSSLNQNLEDYLTNKDNYVESSGVHIQAALQFKLLMFDTFLMYRYTIAEDVVPGSSGFGSVNVRLGMGF
tara:strand:- start:67 stop:768 length:702 start_codon:yes stop_codon:yes gene_type:complete